MGFKAEATLGSTCSALTNLFIKYHRNDRPFTLTNYITYIQLATLKEITIVNKHYNEKLIHHTFHYCQNLTIIYFNIRPTWKYEYVGYFFTDDITRSMGYYILENSKASFLLKRGKRHLNVNLEYLLPPVV